MAERPILFSGPMVRAIIDGRKSQTRRAVKTDVPADAHEVFFWSGEGLRRQGWTNVSEPGLWARRNGRDGYIERVAPCPYGVPGDRLWVRETWGLNHYAYEREPIPKTRPTGLEDQYLAYQATEDDTEIRNELRWRPSIHMPRWMSRLTLEITDVRVERLLSCSEADATSEGLEWVTPGMWSVARHLPIIGDDPRRVYFDLWDHINGAGSSATNPWVWVVQFRTIEDGAS